MPSRPIYPSRHQKKSWRVVTALFVFAFFVVGETITVLLTGWPISAKDLALVTAIFVALDLIGLAVSALWTRMTQNRRQYRRTG